MESQEPTCLERMLFDSVRSYARAWESRCDEEQVEAVRDICSTMARFLGRLLESDERWNRYWWIEDVLPTSVKYPAFAKTLSRYEFSVDGLVIWGQRGSSKQYVEPFWASLSEDGGVFNYHICCGDASRGMGTVSYVERSKLERRTSPERWEFSFSKSILNLDV